MLSSNVNTFLKMKSNRFKCKILHLSSEHQLYKYRIGTINSCGENVFGLSFDKGRGRELSIYEVPNRYQVLF